MLHTGRVCKARSRGESEGESESESDASALSSRGALPSQRKESVAPCSDASTLRGYAAGCAGVDTPCARGWVLFLLKREMSMLRIYPVCLELAREVSGVAGRIGEFDRDLARQLRRSMVSVALNLAEVDGQVGGHRRQRYLTALGSTRESLANLECAVAIGYVPTIDDVTRNKFNHIIGTLVRIAVR